MQRWHQKKRKNNAEKDERTINKIQEIFIVIVQNTISAQVRLIKVCIAIIIITVVITCYVVYYILQYLLLLSFTVNIALIEDIL